MAGELGVEGVDLGGGEDQPVLVSSAGQDEVGGFAVEPVRADVRCV